MQKKRPDYDAGRALARYSECMSEIKLRVAAFDALLNSAKTAPDMLPGLVVAESCYLQLRMITELIALACLTIHGNIPEASSATLSSAYQADKIINAMKKLHPDFYPKPVSTRDDPAGHRHVQDSGKTHLDQNGLAALWRQAGKVLHRGSLEKLGTPKEEWKSPEGAVASRNAIVGLLNEHLIRPYKSDRFFLIQLSTGDTGLVSHAIFEPVAHFTRDETVHPA